MSVIGSKILNDWLPNEVAALVGNIFNLVEKNYLIIVATSN